MIVKKNQKLNFIFILNAQNANHIIQLKTETLINLYYYLLRFFIIKFF